MRRAARLFIQLYPAQWRERYGAEFETLIEDSSPGWRAVFDLNLVGFSPQELQDLLHTEVETGLSDPDDIPQPLDEAETRPGDLWLLGDHRLLCGDAARAEDVDRLLDGSQVHLVNTDPPYNVRVEPRSNNAIAAGLSSPIPQRERDVSIEYRAISLRWLRRGGESDGLGHCGGGSPVVHAPATTRRRADWRGPPPR